jgi:ArsR family transcriptional regulator
VNSDVAGADGAYGRAGGLDPTLLRLLGDPLRARIVELLAVEQLCTCHLVELTGARQTNISNHLRALRDAGLVTASPCGRFTYYRLEPEPLRTLGAALDRLAGAAQDAAERRRPCP